MSMKDLCIDYMCISAFDANGNITDVWENNVKAAEYTYDSLNELTKVKDYVLNKQTEYTYDNGGNKTKNSERALDPATGEPTGTAEEKTFTYNPGGIVEDTLRYIDDFRVRYDNICNPTSYRDGMSMTWTCCELQNITKDNDTYSYSYNINGLRTKKSINGNNTFYYYDDSDNLIGLKKGSTTVQFYYDNNGQLYSMSKGDDTYFFVKTLQGDITKIIDENGTTAATYAYDAWGKLLSENENSAIEGLNPFRYKGYVYDEETELYYLQSRYYDPITGRFLNLDNPEFSDTGSGTPLSTNMFAYCENNPVNNVDVTGEWFHTVKAYEKYILKYKRKYQSYSKYTRNYIKFKNIYQGKVNFANAVRKRYNYNKNIFGNYRSYIFGQNNSYVANIMMGDYYIKNNGCGLIAIYNVLVNKSKYNSLTSIIKEAELNSMLCFNGFWGTLDDGVASFLNNHSINFTNYSTGYGYKYIEDINKYSISILYVINKDGFSRHYFCVLKRSKGSYITLNYHNSQFEFETITIKALKKLCILRVFAIK